MIALSAVMVLLLILAPHASAIRGGHAGGVGIGHGISGAGIGSNAGFTRPGWHGGGIYHGGVTPDHNFVRPGWHGGGIQHEWQPGWNDWNNYRQGWYIGGYPAGGGSPGNYGFSDCYTQCMFQGYDLTYCSQICPV